eukprot:3496326-Rhodomonas_salina.1
MVPICSGGPGSSIRYLSTAHRIAAYATSVSPGYSRQIRHHSLGQYRTSHRRRVGRYQRDHHSLGQYRTSHRRRVGRYSRPVPAKTMPVERKRAFLGSPGSSIRTLSTAYCVGPYA